MSEVVNYNALEIIFEGDFLLFKELENLREINQRNFIMLDRLCKKMTLQKSIKSLQ